MSFPRPAGCTSLYAAPSALFCFLLSVTIAYAAADDVSTQHDDAARTGAQLHETVLKPGNIKSNTFGRLYERSVNGQIIAQPLYAGGVTIPGKGLRNVVYVVTRANVVYAFDAGDLDPDPSHGLLWSQTIEPAGTPIMCGETQGPVRGNEHVRHRSSQRDNVRGRAKR